DVPWPSVQVEGHVHPVDSRRSECPSTSTRRMASGVRIFYTSSGRPVGPRRRRRRVLAELRAPAGGGHEGQDALKKEGKFRPKPLAGDPGGRAAWAVGGRSL